MDPLTEPKGPGDTDQMAPYGVPVRRSVLLFVAALLMLSVSPVLADTGPFRRTTPRASFDRDAGGLVVGIPSGRAWGIESGLEPLAGTDALRLVLAVDDPDVAEAFVRVAYYARGDARSRQLRTQDSPFVRGGEDRRIVIDLAPPPGAVAYRVRVLGRLVGGASHSRSDAIRARPIAPPADRGRPRPSLTRLETDRW
jgi:hypothetical protein